MWAALLWGAPPCGLLPLVGCARSFLGRVLLWAASFSGLRHSLGCVLLWQDRFRALIVVVFLSCFVRESIALVLIPTYALMHCSRAHFVQGLVRSGLLFAIWIGGYLLLRSGLLFSSEVGLGAYTSFYNRELMVFIYEYWGGIRGLLVKIVATFGSLWILSAVGFFLASKRMKLLSLAGLLAVGQVVLATDVHRMVGVGFPIVIVLAGFALKEMSRFWAVVLSLACCAYYLCWNYAVFVKPSLFGSLLLTSVVVVWLHHQRLFSRIRSFPRVNHQSS